MNQAQMYANRVWCNGYLIASFMSERQQESFIAARKVQYPKNKYTSFDPNYVDYRTN